MLGLVKKPRKKTDPRDLVKEVDVQTALKERVENQNGLFVKIMAASVIGFPDALCFFKPGRLVLVELKKPKGEMSGGQRTFSRVLIAMGFDVRSIWNKEDAHAFTV